MVNDGYCSLGIAPLPSYGRGREQPGGRYMSFLHGDGLHDVIITGENGTIDGQGLVWWNMWRQRTLRFTRPNLIELMNSRSIIISNVIFKNSPFWNIHPVYCSHVVIQYVTILAPADSPNTDGIDPAIGSETSGGVQDVLAEHINLFNMGVGIHLKTNIGRGGVIRNITVSNVYMENAGKGIKISGDVGDHPDEYYNHNAIPVIKNIVIKDVWEERVEQPGLIRGLRNASFTEICLSNINLRGAIGQRNLPWQCSDVSGVVVQVSPWSCSQLTSGRHIGACSSSF
ncbi:hypothetical protein BUALT_Bualt10G0064200 [Buddleja alternifolia]|uniref:Polygalacturonase n=1 Tax=Buddleja alternifolia TaxID=168488 RepID=A0AAV6X7G1_9LAMI|nr:hypothetical protein BUALT_Bualt10G0064200 [Buddleja alternifolia]